MVLFRDRFRLVAPIYRNRPFTESIIPHRKLCMIREKPRCPRHARSQLGLCGWFYVFSPMNLLLSSFRLGDSSDFPTFPPIRLLPCSFRLGDFPDFTTFPQTCLLPFSFRLGSFPVFQLFPQLTCFLLASGWGISTVFQLFPQPACFPVASSWGILPVLRLFTQPTCFSIAKTPGYKPGVSKPKLIIIAIQLFRFLFTRVRIVQRQNYLCILTAYAIHDLEQ